MKFTVVDIFYQTFNQLTGSSFAFLVRYFPIMCLHRVKLGLLQWFNMALTTWGSLPICEFSENITKSQYHHILIVAWINLCFINATQEYIDTVNRLVQADGNVACWVAWELRLVIHVRAVFPWGCHTSFNISYDKATRRCSSCPPCINDSWLIHIIVKLS